MPPPKMPPTPRDFSRIRYFPGTTGNPFDILLHRSEILQKIPALLFIVLLGLLALIPHFGNWLFSLLLWGFFVLDWILLSTLPLLHRSFGPSKPPVLVLALMRIIFAFLPVQYAIPVQMVGTILVIYGFWIEPHHLRITKQTFHSDKIKSKEPLRILHLGDLHVERFTQRERDLNQYIRDLHPDLILFSGDILNLSYLHDVESWKVARQVISEWQAPMGAFMVSGSPAVDLPENMLELVAGLPIHWLKAETIILEHDGDKIHLTGLTCTHKPFNDVAQLSQLTQPDDINFSILLYHSPDLAPEVSRMGYDLQLSGHTHGGQIRIPVVGALYTGSLYGKAFESGRIQVNRLTLYVTRGIGLEGGAAPRVRLFCPPEIILWEICGE